MWNFHLWNSNQNNNNKIIKFSLAETCRLAVRQKYPYILQFYCWKEMKIKKASGEFYGARQKAGNIIWPKDYLLPLLKLLNTKKKICIKFSAVKNGRTGLRRKPAVKLKNSKFWPWEKWILIIHIFFTPPPPKKKRRKKAEKKLTNFDTQEMFYSTLL